MKTVPTRLVRKVLKKLGLKESSPGRRQNSGHVVWVQESSNRSIRPVLRKKEIHFGVIYSMGNELQNKGIIARADFKKLIQQGS